MITTLNLTSYVKKALIWFFLAALIFLSFANLNKAQAADGFWFQWAEGTCEGPEAYNLLLWSPVANEASYKVVGVSTQFGTQTYEMNASEANEHLDDQLYFKRLSDGNYEFRDYFTGFDVTTTYTLSSKNTSGQTVYPGSTQADRTGVTTTPSANDPKCQPSAPPPPTRTLVGGYFLGAPNAQLLDNCIAGDNIRYTTDNRFFFYGTTGGLYCLRPTQISGYTVSAPKSRDTTHNSYEMQVAGRNCAVQTGGGCFDTAGTTADPKGLDLATDLDFTFQYTAIVAPTATPTPAPPPPPPPPQVTVSGRIYDLASDQGLGSGLKVPTCGPGADAAGNSTRDPVIGSDGAFSFQASSGDLYCIRGPAVEGYVIQNAAVNAIIHDSASPTNSYEWQIAGINCVATPDDSHCQGGVTGSARAKDIDRNIDTGADLAYSVRVKVLTKIELAESSDFATNLITLDSPFPTLTDAVTIASNYTFATGEPGKKFIWARYTADDGTQEVVGPFEIELVRDDNFEITALSCARGEDNNISFEITGTSFGQTAGNVKIDGENKSFEGDWQQNPTSSNPLVVNISNAPAPDQDGYQVVVTRFDGEEAVDTCNPDLAQLSAGAKYFCPAIKGHSEINVKMSIYDGDASTSVKLADELVNITAAGIIERINPIIEFLEGKKYAVSIETPSSLKKFGTFRATSEEGTTLVLNIDLPAGDIFPVNGDGHIWISDKTELNRQWGLVKEATKSGDFNQDLRVNSYDWACMRYNYGETDDLLPSFPIQLEGETEATESGKLNLNLNQG